MENEEQQQMVGKNAEEKTAERVSAKKDHVLAASVLIAAVILSGTWLYTAGSNAGLAIGGEKTAITQLEETVLPSGGVTLPATWGDLGVQLVSEGVIDAEKFEEIYAQRGAFTDEYRDLLLGSKNGKIQITAENSGYLLNLFWALGLANKNPVLDVGEMVNPAYGGAGRFASTAGWTVAKGDAMKHYSRHEFFVLTPKQQELVEKIAKGVYRPCCGNSTYFPDCNHGMAMLGLLELMASQGVSEEEMWKTALAVNAYWFPDNYLTIASHLKSRGIEWSKADPRKILGADYSSARGYANIAAEANASSGKQGGSGCGLDGGGTAGKQSQQTGCGI